MTIPEDADAEEAAAIAAAVRMYAGDAATDTEGDSDEIAARWRLAGRIEALQNRRVRTPKTAPDDPWTTAGRTDRF